MCSFRGRINTVRALKNIVKIVLLLLVLAYALDWVVFRIRLGRGTAISSVTVEQFLKTPLKNNKVELDYTGPADEPCSRTLFPQYGNSAWNTPCWWLRRHTTQWQ